MASSFCLTNTIDRYTDFGYKYYHNLQQDNNRVRMRPRLPLRFDFNDVEIVKMDDPNDPETRAFMNYYRRFPPYRDIVNPNRLYRLKRTGYSIFNTLLLYVLSMVLIVASVINMKKIVQAMQNDSSMGLQNKMMFRLSFVFSFVVVLFLSCFIGLSVFELYRNTDIFRTFTATNNFRYKNIRIQDGNMYYLRYMLLLFVIIGILFALAETINLFMMKPHKPLILVLLVPILFCIILLIHLYNFSQRRNVV
jgi:hypothetical protein